MKSDSLLTISQASRMLGVSEPALRSWTDEGQIKAMITPGGHRRYLKADLEKFIGSNQKKLGIKGLTERFDATVPIHREMDSNYFQNHAGFNSLDETTQRDFAALGRQLMDHLVQCVTRRSKSDDLEPARNIGRNFGKLTSKLDIPLVDAIQTFVRHRRPVLISIFEMARNGEITQAQLIEAVPSVDRAIDEALFALVAAHQELSSNNDRVENHKIFPEEPID